MLMVWNNTFIFGCQKAGSFGGRIEERIDRIKKFLFFLVGRGEKRERERERTNSATDYKKKTQQDTEPAASLFLHNSSPLLLCRSQQMGPLSLLWKRCAKGSITLCLPVGRIHTGQTHTDWGPCRKEQRRGICIATDQISKAWEGA